MISVDGLTVGFDGTTFLWLHHRKHCFTKTIEKSEFVSKYKLIEFTTSVFNKF